MKKSNLITLVFVGFMVAYSSYAQTRFSAPIHAQNTFVYNHPQSIEFQIFSFQKSLSQNLPADTFYLLQTLISSSYYYWITKSNNDGVVLGNSDSDWEEFYPSSPPIQDSVYLKRMSYQHLDSSICYILRRFDTTVFSSRVNAFTCLIPNAREVTVADSFGMIRYIEIRGTYRDTANLYSCIIDGVNYNWETQEYHWMSLCLGNVYQYHESFFPTKFSTYVITRDTIINSNRYFYHQSEGWLREDQKGLFRFRVDGKEEMILPTNATTGTVIIYAGKYWFVVNASVHYYFGRDRKILQLKRIARIDEDETDMEWVEGIGETAYGWLGRPDGKYLTYFKCCTEEWGTFVGVEHYSTEINNFYLGQNYPNPFSQQTAISFKLFAFSHVRLEIFDFLGRKVAALVDENKEAGEYTSMFDVRNSLLDIHSGIYFYRLIVGKNVFIKKMIVIH